MTVTGIDLSRDGIPDVLQQLRSAMPRPCSTELPYSMEHKSFAQHRRP